MIIIIIFLLLFLFHIWLHLNNLKHYANTTIFSAAENENFQLIIFDIFLIFAQNIDCGYKLEYTQSYVLRANIRKIGLPQFYYRKVWFKGEYI